IRDVHVTGVQTCALPIFGTMARLYSQDPGSAADGGEYPFSDRNTWVKEFTKTAFKLKPGEISNVFETEFGYHILEVLERRGEQRSEERRVGKEGRCRRSA